MDREESFRNLIITVATCGRYLQSVGSAVAGYHSMVTNMLLSRTAQDDIWKEAIYNIEKQSQDIMRNVMSGPNNPGGRVPVLGLYDFVTENENRGYMKILVHFTYEEFIILSNLLEPLIERKRTDNIENAGHANYCKLTSKERLFYTLLWVSTGISFRALQILSGLSKSAINDDVNHVLYCIIEGLDGELRWPDTNRRAELAQIYHSIFRGCIGILDCTEHIIDKPKNAQLEYDTYSGKVGANTIKTMAVVDSSGKFLYVQTVVYGRTNDRDMWTSSPLFMRQEEFLDDGQFLASDGGFEGAGHGLLYSYKTISHDFYKKIFNLAFQEVRKQVENAFGRIQLWFPVLGNAKAKWNCSISLLCMTVHAAARLHNWLLSRRRLDYDPAQNPDYLFRNIF